MELTNRQRAILLAMVRREAKSLGYGVKYVSYDTKSWPRRLKELKIIAGKLRDEENTR